jgi:hypothetical protein
MNMIGCDGERADGLVPMGWFGLMGWFRLHNATNEFVHICFQHARLNFKGI